MKKVLALLTFICAIVACSSTPSNRLVYSSGFSFANYDYILIGKPDSAVTHTALYGMDVEFSNLMSRYNMKVIGDKEYENLAPNYKQRTLLARMSATASDEVITLSVSFDDSLSGRTGASITGSAEGDIFDFADRNEVFETVSTTIVKALQSDKGLHIADDRKSP